MSDSFMLRQGDRLVFLGDSITEQQLYTNYVEAYLAARYPELKLTFFNAGWGGDTAPGGCARLERDVLALKPNVVTICYGMNDGGYCPLTPEILDRFEAGMRELVSRLKAAGVRVVLLTPGMADVTVNADLRRVDYNNRSLRALADAVQALAAAEQLPVADLHMLMNNVDGAAKAAKASFCMIPDSVHPDPAGHLVMAFGLLQALGVPPRNEELTVDIPTRQATGTAQTAVRHLRHTRDGDVLEVRFDKLPFFVEPAARKVLPYLPFQETYNSVKLRVTGIAQEWAFIRAGATRNASLPRAAFERGINLFDLRGGGAMKAAATVHAYTREKDQLYFRLWRAVALNGGNTGGYDRSVHREAVRLGTALDRARERLGGRSALTMRLVVTPAEQAGEKVANGDFIGRWSFLGPFGKPFADDKAGGEAALTATVPILTGNWFSFDLDLDALANNLTPVFGARTDSFGYALTTLDSPVDQDAELLLGSDDGYAVWLNGERLGGNLEIGRWLQPDSDRMTTRLRQGRNVLLVKITQISGEWGFCVRFHGLRAPIWATRPQETTHHAVLTQPSCPVSKATNREIVLAQIRHRETCPVPYWFTIDEEVAQRLDVHYGGRQWRERIQTFVEWTDLVNGDKKEPTGVPHRQRDPYGSVWRTDQRVFHLEVPALPEPTLAGYRWPAPEAFYGDAAWVEKAQHICCAKKGQTFLTTWLGWGLFETSWGLRGFENVMTDVVCETPFYEALLDRIMEQFYVWIDYICKTLPEVDAIFLGDDWSDQRGVIIGPERWRELFKPRYAKLYAYIHARDKLVIEHVCGSVSPLIPDLIDIGLDVLESLQPEAHDMNPYELKRRWGDKITFMGGLGSQSIIQFGKPQELRTEIRRLRTEMSRGGGYILAPSKFLQPGTPTENAAAIFEEFTA